MTTVLYASLLLLCTHLSGVEGHGYMRSPAGRSSAWRIDSTYFHINYDDNANYCGGRAVQHEVNGGKCGICGDDFRLLPPRYNERGGYFSTGNIVAQYASGSTIEVEVVITASHLGTFTFDLFQSNSSTELEVDSEFEALPLADGSAAYQLTSWNPHTYRLNITLPDVVCSYCVLRWKYRTGNHAGNEQENFRSCADVMITRSGSEAVPQWVEKDPTKTKNPITQGPYTEQPTTQQTTTHVPTTSEPTSTTTIKTTKPNPTTTTTLEPTTQETTTQTTTTTSTTTTTTTTQKPTTFKIIHTTTQEPTTISSTSTSSSTAPTTTATTRAASTTGAPTANGKPLAQFRCPAICHSLCAQATLCPSFCNNCPEYNANK